MYVLHKFVDTVKILYTNCGSGGFIGLTASANRQK